VREQSGTVTVPNARCERLGILPRRLHGRGGAVVVAANDAAAIPMEDPDGKTYRYATCHSVRGFAAR